MLVLKRDWVSERSCVYGGLKKKKKRASLNWKQKGMERQWGYLRMGVM